MRLDSHQHFWRYDAAQYPWISPGSPLERDWLPADLEPLLADAGIDGCIAVQARQSVEESRWLLELATESPIIAGVVGWVDLRDERVGEQLAELSANPKFRGVRHVVQDEPDANFLLGAAFRHGISLLREFGLTYDLLIFPHQLPAAIELVQQFPEQPFVLDHIAKPPIKSGALSPWREWICALAAAPNVSCKVSGLITEADPENSSAQDIAPYLAIVAEAFGEDRVMFGSDWPVCLLAGSYERVFSLIEETFAPRGKAACEQLFGTNARRFYLGAE